MRLIKTAIELTKLGNYDDIILLGSWCLAGADNKSLFGSKNITIPYHWDDREKYYNDYVDLTNLYEELLLSLVPILNNIHNIDRGIRYWRILVGPWLRFLIDAVFDRYECTRVAKKNNSELTYELYSYNLTDWCPTDFSEFYIHLTSEEWNEVIISECIKFQKTSFIEVEECLFPAEDLKKKRFSAIRLCRDGLKWLSSKYSEVIGVKYEGSVLVGAYLPTRKLLRLYLGLSQMPFFSLPIIKIKGSKVDQTMREYLKISSNTIGFEGLIKSLLPVLMPKIYIEDFSEVRIKALAKCPSKPKSIFTANSYQADDVFKIWAAEKVADGVPLILGQHGGNFAIVRHSQTIDHQIQIADNFVTWGWVHSVENHVIKLPSMQLCDRKKIVPDKKGNILLIETSLPRYFYCHYDVPIAGQFLHYLQDQLDFINRLEPAILNNLNIRLDLSPSMLSKDWDVQGVFDESGYSNKVAKSKQTLSQAIKKSRVCVCTSNSTVFLETLSLNFPTVVFWDPDYNKISLEAKPYIDILVKAEILFFSAIQAADHINKLNSNVNDWWFSTEVQLAREIFCEHYALTSPDWLDAWRKLLSTNQKIF